MLWWFCSRVEFGVVQRIDGYASEDALSNGHMLTYFDRVRSLRLSIVARPRLYKIVILTKRVRIFPCFIRVQVR